MPALLSLSICLPEARLAAAADHQPEVRAVEFIWPADTDAPIHGDLPRLIDILDVEIGAPYGGDGSLEIRALQEFLRDHKAVLDREGDHHRPIVEIPPPTQWAVPGVLEVVVEVSDPLSVPVADIVIKDFPDGECGRSDDVATIIADIVKRLAVSVTTEEPVVAGAPSGGTRWHYNYFDLVQIRDALPQRVPEVRPDIRLKRAEYSYDRAEEELIIYVSEEPLVGAVMVEYVAEAQREPGATTRQRDLTAALAPYRGQVYSRLDGAPAARGGILRAVAETYVAWGFFDPRVGVAISDDAYGLCTVSIEERQRTHRYRELEVAATGDSPSGRVTASLAFSHQNLRRRHEQLRLAAGIGGRRGAQLSVAAVRDVLHERPWKVDAGHWTTYDVDLGGHRFDETETGLQVSLPVASTYRRWRSGLAYRRSRDRLRPVAGGPSQEVDVGIASMTLRHDPAGVFDRTPTAAPGGRSNAPDDDARGKLPLSLQADVGLAGGLLGGEDSFATAGLDARQHWRLGEGLLAAVRIGVGWSSADTPVTEQFTLGGDGVAGLLRGHDPEQLRGRRVLFANLELRRALGRYLEGATFLDAARIADGPNPSDGTVVDGGIGLRYVVGGGLPIALFWAYGEEGGRVSFATDPGF